MFTRDVYKDDKAPSIALLAVTIKKYGIESLEYEPELLRQEINRDYDIRISTLNHDKLQAAITVLFTEAFENDWRVFETCCHLFNNTLVDHDIVNPLEAEELIVGIVEATIIKESILEDKEKLHYDDEIRVYAGRIFYDYGFHKAPKLFSEAIMPKTVGGSDKEKNAALNELFEAHTQYILDYLEKINV
jgi:hypothetical protein